MRRPTPVSATRTASSVRRSATSGKRIGSAGGSGQGNTGAVDPRGVTGVQVGQNQPGQPPAGVARVVYFDYDSFAIKADADVRPAVPVLSLHTQLSGMPVEPFAFSNNAVGNMGPAKWEAAAFEIAGPTVQTITFR